MPQRLSDSNAVRAAVDSGGVTLLVDESVYSRETLLRTCYWFTDRCYLFVSRAELRRIFRPYPGKSGWKGARHNIRRV